MDENGVKQLSYSTTFLLLGSNTYIVCCIISRCAPSLCYPSHSTFKTSACLYWSLCSTVKYCGHIHVICKFHQLVFWKPDTAVWQAEQWSLLSFWHTSPVHRHQPTAGTGSKTEGEGWVYSPCKQGSPVSGWWSCWGTWYRTATGCSQRKLSARTDE